MRFTPLQIGGAWLVELQRHVDQRGYFARAWCREEFAAHGIGAMAQASISFNRRAGTLRGLHFTWPPATEGKLVRCSRGRVFDVLLDLRPDSNTFMQHRCVVLEAAEYSAVYIPAGVAHGFQALLDDCEIYYMMTEAYRPDLADGVRFDDPCFAIGWPMPVSEIAERDRQYPDFDMAQHRLRYAASL